MKDALQEIESMRRFMVLRLFDDLPEEATILNCRHHVERNGLGQFIFDSVTKHLADAGLRIKEGTAMDTSITAALSPARNREKVRDAEFHQMRKGCEWHLGLEVHIGVDDALGVIYLHETTSAIENDVTAFGRLLYGDKNTASVDASYARINKCDEHRDA